MCGIDESDAYLNRHGSRRFPRSQYSVVKQKDQVEKVKLAGLPSAVSSVADEVMAPWGGLDSAHRFDGARLVADHADKYVLYGTDRRARAVLTLSPASHPRVAEDAAALAAAAKDRLGVVLGAHVLVPLHVGDADGLSFSISPHCGPFSNATLAGHLRKWRLRRRVFDWLRDVTRRIATTPQSHEIEAHFAEPLRRIALHPMLPLKLHTAAQRALDDLDSHAWRPRFALAHNDFWPGNLLGARTNGACDTGFVVIDWAAPPCQATASMTWSGWQCRCVCRALPLPLKPRAMPRHWAASRRRRGTICCVRWAGWPATWANGRSISSPSARGPVSNTSTTTLVRRPLSGNLCIGLRGKSSGLA